MSYIMNIYHRMFVGRLQYGMFENRFMPNRFRPYGYRSYAQNPKNSIIFDILRKDKDFIRNLKTLRKNISRSSLTAILLKLAKEAMASTKKLEQQHFYKDERPVYASKSVVNETDDTDNPILSEKDIEQLVSQTNDVDEMSSGAKPETEHPKNEDDVEHSEVAYLFNRRHKGNKYAKMIFIDDDEINDYKLMPITENLRERIAVDKSVQPLAPNPVPFQHFVPRQSATMHSFRECQRKLRFHNVEKQLQMQNYLKVLMKMRSGLKLNS